MEQTEYQEQLRELTQRISKSRRIISFGGAGVSTRSGIPDFRSADRLYVEKRYYPPEQIVNHSFFLMRTGQSYDFYKGGILCPDVESNAVHLALTVLKRQGKLSAVIIQNIDGLHEKTGSKRISPLHGMVLRNCYLYCEKLYSLAGLLPRPGTVPHCDYGGIIEPDVVFYEEALDSALLTETARHIVEADLLIVGRTSLAAYPTAGLLRCFGRRHLVVINRNVTPADRDTGLVIQAPIGEMLPKVLEEARWNATFTVFALVKRLKIR